MIIVLLNVYLVLLFILVKLKIIRFSLGWKISPAIVLLLLLFSLKGGLSAENYISITGTFRATATRDLQDLIAKAALTKTGELLHTRYHLNLAKA
jgi:Fic family protein